MPVAAWIFRQLDSGQRSLLLEVQHVPQPQRLFSLQSRVLLESAEQMLKFVPTSVQTRSEDSGMQYVSL